MNNPNRREFLAKTATTAAVIPIGTVFLSSNEVKKQSVEENDENDENDPLLTINPYVGHNQHAFAGTIDLNGNKSALMATISGNAPNGVFSALEAICELKEKYLNLLYEIEFATQSHIQKINPSLIQQRLLHCCNQS